MRRFLTIATVFGTVITAPALAMAATHAATARHAATSRHAATTTRAVAATQAVTAASAAHPGRGRLSAYSVRATPTSARMGVGHRMTMTVAVTNKTRQSQLGLLTIRWRAGSTTARLAVTPARPCAYDRKAATSACAFTAGPHATARMSFAVRGTAPGTANAVVTATPDRASRSGAARAAAKTAPATTTATLQVVRHSQPSQPASRMCLRLAGPSHTTHGMSVHYTATVANHGRRTARGVQFEMSLPRGLADVAVSPKTAACKIAGQRLVKCTVRRIRAAGTAAVTVQAAVTAPVWRHVAVASGKAGATGRTPGAQANARSAARLGGQRGQRHDLTRTVPRRLTVTARITHMMCPCCPCLCGPSGTPAGPNYVPGSQTTLTTVMKPNPPVAPLAVPGRTVSPAKLPMTGVPVLAVTIAGAALLGLGALGLIASRTRRRRNATR